ncbi:MAG: hypothetical protein ACFFCS_24935, partial [Candidatus Hodarchaeota archaeon]
SLAIFWGHVLSFSFAKIHLSTLHVSLGQDINNTYILAKKRELKKYLVKKGIPDKECEAIFALYTFDPKIASKQVRDIQILPILSLPEHFLLIPNLLTETNFPRNYRHLVTHLEEDLYKGKWSGYFHNQFRDEIASIFKNVGFSLIGTGIKYKINGEEGDIDLVTVFKDSCLIFEMKALKEGDSAKDLEYNDQELIHAQEQLDSLKKVIELHPRKINNLFKNKGLGDINQYQISYFVLFENFLGTEHVEHRYLVLSKIHIQALADQAQGNPGRFIDDLIQYPSLPRADVIDEYKDFKIGRFTIRVPYARYENLDEFRHVKPPD